MSKEPKSPGIKRIYDPPSRADGMRILIDRMWPRGISKERAAIDLWLKEIAPSSDLRKWFGHAPERWLEFKVRYHKELDRNPDAVDQLRALTAKGRITLLYGARDPMHNNAAALADYMKSIRRRKP